MKFLAIALDYDGLLHRMTPWIPGVYGTPLASFARGIVVLIVTGRVMSELRRVAVDLHFVELPMGTGDFHLSLITLSLPIRLVPVRLTPFPDGLA